MAISPGHEQATVSSTVWWGSAPHRAGQGGKAQKEKSFRNSSSLAQCYHGVSWACDLCGAWGSVLGKAPHLVGCPALAVQEFIFEQGAPCFHFALRPRTW